MLGTSLIFLLLSIFYYEYVDQSEFDEVKDSGESTDSTADHSDVKIEAGKHSKPAIGSQDETGL